MTHRGRGPWSTRLRRRVSWMISDGLRAWASTPAGASQGRRSALVPARGAACGADLIISKDLFGNATR